MAKFLTRSVNSDGQYGFMDELNPLINTDQVGKLMSDGNFIKTLKTGDYVMREDALVGLRHKDYNVPAFGGEVCFYTKPDHSLSPADTWTIDTDSESLVHIYEGMYTAFDYPKIRQFRIDHPDYKYFNGSYPNQSLSNVDPTGTNVIGNGRLNHDMNNYSAYTTENYGALQTLNCGHNGIFAGSIYMKDANNRVKMSYLGVSSIFPYRFFVNSSIIMPFMTNDSGAFSDYIIFDGTNDTAKYLPNDITGAFYDRNINAQVHPISEYVASGKVYGTDFFSFQHLRGENAHVFVGQMMSPMYFTNSAQEFNANPIFGKSYICANQELRIEYRINQVSKAIFSRNSNPYDRDNFNGIIMIHQLPPSITDPTTVFNSGTYDTLKQYLIHEDKITDELKTITLRAEGHLSITTVSGFKRIPAIISQILPSDYAARIS